MLRSLANWNGVKKFVQTTPTINCNCTSASTGRLHNFCYVNPQNTTLVGKKFSCNHLEKLEDLKLLDYNSSNSSISPKNESQIVFVSSTTDDQFDFSLSSFKCIREFYPDHKYILYGLRLNSSFMDQLPGDDLNFEFRQLYAPENHYKSVILAKILKDFSKIFWVDPEMAMRKPNVLKKLVDGSSNSSFLSIRDNHYNVYSGVNEGTARYFPISSLGVFKNTSQVEASVMYIERSEKAMEILKWWTLCTLTDNCVQRGSNSRYEQSMLNILLLNELQNKNNYFVDDLKSSFVTMKDLV